MCSAPVDDSPVADDVLDAAIGWQLLLDSGHADAKARAGFAHWLAAQPEHARAWRQLGGIDGSLRALAPMRDVLVRPRQRIPARAWLGSVVLMAAVLLGAMAVERQTPLRGWLSDQHTATGERRMVMLEDGSELVLNSRSAVDIDFEGEYRLIQLRSGEIAVRTGHGDARPFLVETPHGVFRALGTRFTVRLEPSYTLLSVQESAVLARPAQCGADLATPCTAERRIDAGQGGRIDDNSVVGPLPVPPHADAWLKGMLVVEDVALGDVVAELQRHQRGFLSVAPEVAGLRVTGTVPLDDPTMALDSLTHALPVKIVRRTGLWLHVAQR